MKFISANYWQPGENASSLLLQQCRLGETEVLLACVTSGATEESGRAGGYLTGRLLEWFRGIPLKRAVKNPESFLRREAAQLEHLVKEADFELAQAGIGQAGYLRARIGQTKPARAESEKVGFAGILCMGWDFLLFGRGSTSVFLLNRSMGKAGAERLFGTGELSESGRVFGTGELPEAERDSGAEKIQICQGIMEPEVGLLLATESFISRIPEKEWKEGLFVVEIQTESQAEKHLMELGSAAEKSGGRHMAAVLFYAG